MYNNYIFDLYGTLIDINTNEERELLWDKMALIYGYNGAVYTAEEFKKSYFDIANDEEDKIIKKNQNKIVKKDDVHESHPEIQLEYVFQKLFINKGVQADMNLCIHVAQSFRALSTEYIKLYDGVKELLTALKENGGKVYLLSNAQKVFTIYEMKMLGIYDYFDDIFISSECLCKKPDVRFMEQLINKHKLKIKESIMIGNDILSDIGVAKQVDMDTFYIHSNLSPKADEDKIDDTVATYVINEMDLNKVRKMLVG